MIVYANTDYFVVMRPRFDQLLSHFIHTGDQMDLLGNSSDILYHYVLPGVIIGTMLILAIALACILRRKQKSGNLHLFFSESLPPRGPVILKDEQSSKDSENSFTCGSLPYDEYTCPSDDKNNFQVRSNLQALERKHPELEKLLAMEEAPIIISPHSLKCPARPSPIYNKRQEK